MVEKLKSDWRPEVKEYFIQYVASWPVNTELSDILDDYDSPSSISPQDTDYKDSSASGNDSD